MTVRGSEVAHIDSPPESPVGAKRPQGEKSSRVLLIAPQPFFANRGTPFNVRAMVESLSEHGYGVDLLVYPIGDDVDLPESVTVYRSMSVPGIRTVPIGASWKKIVLDFFLLFSALGAKVRRRHDVIHGVEEGAVIAGVLAFIFRKPYVFDMDSCMPEQLRNSGFIRSEALLSFVAGFEAFFIRHASSVLTVCQALTDKVKQIAPDSPVIQIEDCPLDSAGEVSEALVSSIRLRFGLGGARKVFLYTGNLEPYQGLDLLIEAFALFPKDDSTLSCSLVIVGGGDERGEQLEHYRNLARALGVEQRVVFAGLQPPEHMGAYMAVADVLVSPRLVGGNTPLKVYSYMAAERPIVATNISSHTQLLDDSNAFLAEPTPEAFFAALHEALGVNESTNIARARRVRRSKELVETRYSRKEFSRRLGLMYSEILGCSEVQSLAPVEKR